MVARQSAVHAAFGANILQRCTGSFQLALFSSLFFLPLFLFSFPPPPPPPPFRLFTFFHVAHVTGLLERGSRGKKGGKKRRRCIAAKVNEKKDRRARPAAFPNPILRFHGPPRKSLPASPPPRLPSPPFFRFSLSPRGGRVLSRGFLAFTFVLPDWRGEMMISFPFFFSFPPQSIAFP